MTFLVMLFLAVKSAAGPRKEKGPDLRPTPPNDFPLTGTWSNQYTIRPLAYLCVRAFERARIFVLAHQAVVAGLQLFPALCERDGVGFVAVAVCASVDVRVPVRQGPHEGEADCADVLFLVG